MRDHVDQIFWHDIFGQGGSGSETPGAVDLHDRLVIDKVVHKRGDEQRLPLGAPEHRSGERRSELLVLEAQGEVVLHLGFGQSIELQLAAPPVDLQILMQTVNRMCAYDAVANTIGGKNEHFSLAVSV